MRQGWWRKRWRSPGLWPFSFSHLSWVYCSLASRPGSGALHCLSIGIIFSWPVFGPWLFLSYNIAFLTLACLFSPECLAWISPSSQCHSFHSSTVTHSMLGLISTQAVTPFARMHYHVHVETSCVICTFAIHIFNYEGREPKLKDFTHKHSRAEGLAFLKH